MSSRIAIIDCSVPVNTRNQKIIDSITKYLPSSELHVITWNRDGRVLEKNPNYHVYEKIAPYADYKAKLLGMKGFKSFIGESLETIRPLIIIASHWSNLILTAGFKKDGQKLVYENLDIPTGSGIIRFVSSLLERHALRNVDLIIHASRFFRPLYEMNVPQVILENKPMFASDYSNTPARSPFRIAFIGSIRYKQILKNLIDAVRDDKRFELFFHGNGEDFDAIAEYCKGMPNVCLTGAYSYSTIIGLYHSSDLIWAAYPSEDYNAIYAISNKFHESLYVGVPCVYSKHTKLAEFVEHENLGFVVNPYSVDEIKALFDSIVSGKHNIDNVKKSMLAYMKNESTWDQDFCMALKYIME